MVSILSAIYRQVSQMAQALAAAVATLKAELSAGNAAQRQEILELRLTVQSNNDESRESLATIKGKLDEILNLLHLNEAARVVFTVTIEGHTTTGVTNMRLTDSQQALLSVEVLDKANFAAALDGVPVWAVSDETIATVDASADATGLTATLKGVRPGTCTVTFTGDADLGSGVVPIVGTLDVEVTAGMAVQVKILAADPTEQ